MQPMFQNGDYVLVDQLTYHFRDPQRGDVMVFHATDKTYFIKRAMGLPGDHLSIHDGKITIQNKQYPNGLILNEPYLAPGTQTSGDVDITLGPDEYYVLGDNRSYSYDSRSWGILKRAEIVGVVRVRLWPLTHIRTFPAPQY
jgi:signal peptidase I